MSRQRAPVRHVRTVAEAQALADLLCAPSRRAPVAVISTASHAAAPYVDADLVAEALTGFADVYVIVTGEVSWAFSHVMPARTQVYGGASRVYPADDAWHGEPRTSPLRFAWRQDTSGRVADELIRDALGMAVAGGFRVASEGADTVRVTGTVTRVTGGRAFVRLGDDSLATIWPELVVPGATGLAPESIVSTGMAVSGLLDRVSRRIDVSDLVRPAKVALADYAVDDQVLVRVFEVERDYARVEVFPREPGTISAQHLAGATGADARDYVSAGDVLVVRVRDCGGLGAKWRFSALGTDLDEPVHDAPPILEGGPPWLTRPPLPQPDDTPAESVGDADEGGVEPVAPAARQSSGSAAPATAAPATAAPATAAPAIARIVPKPTPPPGARVAPRSPAIPPTPGPPPAPPASSLPASSLPASPLPTSPPPTSLLPTSSLPTSPSPMAARPPRVPTPMDLLRRPKPAAEAAPAGTPPTRQLGVPRPAVSPAPGPASGSSHRSVALPAAASEQLVRERDQLATELERVTAQLESAQLKRSRIQHRLRVETTLRERHARRIAELEELAGRARADESLFDDPAEQLDFDIRIQWARRIPRGEKAARPLASYRLGPDFFTSWEAVDGVERSKVVDVIVEVLIGVDAALPGRELHQLRRGPGGNDPFVGREDGATCWRVSLQVKTAQARRLHYWRLPDGSVELSSVRLHDDMRP